MKTFDTVLFDFDGTVMDTNEVIIQSWQHTFRTLEGKERDVREIIKTFGEPLALTMEKAFPHIPVKESIDIYRSYHYDNFGQLISLFPGMEELIQELKRRGYKMGLVTSRLRATTIQGLEKYGIKDYFQTIVTAEDTDKHKPDPEPIYIALNNLGSQAKNSIMLGDTMFDILCARNAGVKSALVSWAMAVTEEDLTGPNKPDYVIQRAQDLLEIIKKERS